MNSGSKKIEISDNTEIFYPESERENLIKCSELDGFKKELISHTGISFVTLQSILEKWKGRKRVVNAIREFVPRFMEAMEQPLKSAS